MEIRLKFWSTGHLTLSNMSKLIPHCSNRWKIVFWAWWGSNFIEMKNFKKQKSFILWSEPMVKWFLAKSKFCKLSPPLPLVEKLFLESELWDQVSIFVGDCELQRCIHGSMHVLEQVQGIMQQHGCNELSVVPRWMLWVRRKSVHQLWHKPEQVINKGCL